MDIGAYAAQFALVLRMLSVYCQIGVTKSQRLSSLHA